jgi:multidrug resistance efflux pump
MTEREESAIRRAVAVLEERLATMLEDPHALRSKIDKMRAAIERLRAELKGLK